MPISVCIFFLIFSCITDTKSKTLHPMQIKCPLLMLMITWPSLYLFHLSRFHITIPNPSELNVLLVLCNCLLSVAVVVCTCDHSCRKIALDFEQTLIIWSFPKTKLRNTKPSNNYASSRHATFVHTLSIHPLGFGESHPANREHPVHLTPTKPSKSTV